MKKYLYLIICVIGFSACNGSSDNICEENKGAWEKQIIKEAGLDGAPGVKFNYGKAEIVKNDGTNVVCKMSGVTTIDGIEGPQEEVMFRLLNIKSGKPKLVLGGEIKY